MSHLDALSDLATALGGPGDLTPEARRAVTQTAASPSANAIAAAYRAGDLELARAIAGADPALARTL